MKMLLLILLLNILKIAVTLTLPCALRRYSYGLVCVCNATYCDTLDELNPEGPNGFILVSSSKAGLRFSVQNGTFAGSGKEFIVHDNKLNYSDPFAFWNTIKSIKIRFNHLVGNRDRDYYERISTVEDESKIVQLRINRNKKYQKIIGFGGALTGAVSYNLQLISDDLRHQIYKLYFEKKSGIGYNFLRIPIGGCDFDLNPWAYNEFPINDKTLSNFTKLDYRDEIKIEQLKEIYNVAGNSEIKLFGSAWSPPPWMKSNNKWSGRSHLKREYYQTWADYHKRFLELWKAKNITFWAISTGNEPLNGVIGWLFIKFMSLGWTPKDQGKWLVENLFPTIKDSSFNDLKIFSNDDQRYTFPLWFLEMDRIYKNATRHLDGLAVHWYWDNVFTPEILDYTHKLYENKIIINTESSAGDKPWEYHGPELGNWNRAEKYIKSYIEDFQHWVNGWIDWNLILDENGGPNYIKNYVDAPIIINTTNKIEFYKQPIFYAIGHFSKFIQENSMRIDAVSSDENVKIVAFERPNENVVAIMYNSKKTSIHIEILDSKHSNIVIKLPPKSVHTIIYK